MDNTKCPNCNAEITTRKYEIFNCNCGKKLMKIKSDKKEMVVDVTPNKEEI